MKPLTSICCKDIIRDAETNAISLHNLIEEINAEGFSAFIPKFCIFLLTEKEKNDKDTDTGSLKLFSNGKEIYNFDIKYDFQGKKRARNIIKIGGFAVPNPGTFSIQFFLRDKLLSKVTIPATVISPPKVETK